jgi:hypothetical protein
MKIALGLQTQPEKRTLRLTRKTGNAELMKDYAQQEKTTVHGALCAALVIAGRQAIGEWADEPVRILSPIDIRKLLGIGDHCGLFVSAEPVSFKSGETDFWELARFAKRQLAGA